MKKSTFTLAIVFVFSIGIIGLASTSAFAWGDWGGGWNVENVQDQGGTIYNETGPFGFKRTEMVAGETQFTNINSSKIPGSLEVNNYQDLEHRYDSGDGFCKWGSNLAKESQSSFIKYQSPGFSH